LVIPSLLIIASTMLTSVVLCSSFFFLWESWGHGDLLKRKMMRTSVRTTFGFCLMGNLIQVHCGAM
jgi:hypothetical protein